MSEELCRRMRTIVSPRNQSHGDKKADLQCFEAEKSGNAQSEYPQDGLVRLVHGASIA